MPNIDPDDVTEYIALPAVDPGMERAGAAAAARRRELDISQRSLAADGISQEQFRLELRRQLTQQRLREREVDARVRVSDHEIDHRVPLHLGGKNDDENLQTLCRSTDGHDGCHDKKTRTEAGNRAGYCE